MDEETQIKEAILKTGRLLLVKGLVRGTGGNISVRSGDGFIITPSGMAYDSMEAEDLVKLDFH